MIIRQKNWWGARKHRHPKLATGKIWEVLFDRAVGVLANLPQSGAYLFCGPSLGELFILHSPPYSFSAFLLLCFFVFFAFSAFRLVCFCPGCRPLAKKAFQRRQHLYKAHALPTEQRRGLYCRQYVFKACALPTELRRRLLLQKPA